MTERLDTRHREKTTPVVSVVIPCLNEARGIGKSVEKALEGLRALNTAGEVIVVDNGSNDGSPEIAARAGACVVHERRRGYGAAYLRGFREARGACFVMGDGDDSYDFRDIPRFVTPLQAGDVDMVMGTRLKGHILPGAMPWTHRWIGNPILSGILRMFFGTRISDSHCGMRSFTREAFKRMHLRTQGMEFASEIVVNALREGLRIAEVPITYYPREGESKLRGLSDAWRHMRFMLIYAPSYLFQLPGILLMVMGGVLVISLAGGPRVLFGREWDFHVLLFGAFAVILGYNFLLFDVFAKTFSMGAGLARSRQWLRRLVEWFTLERGLAGGGVLLLTGLGLEAKIIADWVRSGYGELMAVRGIVIGMMAMVLGAQTVFASFLLSLLLVRRAVSAPRIGFSIPYHENLDYLRAAVESVRDQSCSDWTAVVVDNGAEETGARELVERLGDHRITYHRTGNLGIGPNWNVCLDLSTTELVTILHGDDQLLPHYAETMLRTADRYPEPAAFFCRAGLIDEDGSPVRTMADSFKRVLLPPADPRAGTIELKGESAARRLLQGNFLVAPSLCYRRERIQQFRFSHRWRFVLDLDFYLRLLLDGRVLLGTTELALSWRRHASTTTAQMTRTLERFREEAEFLNTMVGPLVSAGWVDAARTARRKTVPKLHIGWLAVTDVLRLRPRDALAKLSLMSELCRSSPTP